MFTKRVFYRLICILAFLTLSVNAASPVSQSQAKQIGMDGPEPPTPAPAALGSLAGDSAHAPAFTPLTGDSPIAQPSINAQPVLERARQMGDGPEQRIQRGRTPALNKLGEQQAVSSAPEKTQADLVQSSPVDQLAPAALQSLAGLPSTQSVGKTRPPAFDPLASLQNPITDSCYDWLYNSDFEINNAEGWYEYIPSAYPDSNYYASPSTSYRMVEDVDAAVGDFGDVDAFGQVFYFPDWYDGFDFNSLDLWFQTAELVGPGDSLYVEFYEADEYGNVNWKISLGYIPVILENTGVWTSHYFTVNSDDSYVSIQNMKGKYVAILLIAYGDNDLDNYYDISVDDIYMSLCTSPSVPSGMILGQVTQENGLASAEYGLSDAAILLTYEDATTDGPQVIDWTMADSDGYYLFYSLFPLPDDYSGWYQIWFMNTTEDDTRVMLWAGPWTDIFVDDDFWLPDNFDISNVVLDLPANEAVTAFNSGITFEWSGRAVPGETYYLCMYDELSVLYYNTVCNTYPVDGTQLTLTKDSFSGVPGFIVYGHRYLWYVLPWSNGIGYSYYMSGLTILAEDPPVIEEPIPVGPPPADPDAREWLLMIYLAGDNNLGDPAIVNSPSSFIKHFETLQEIAPAYTNIHVVTLSDFLDSSGTQLCYISVSPAQCQQLGELDTANPDTLANFIDTAMTQFSYNRAALVISDHGHGVSGIAVDETTHRKSGSNTVDGYMMNPTELRAALTSAGLNTTKLDLLYFNTCLMGNLETTYSVQDFAEYMVAASNEMWMMDIYTAMLPLFNNTTLADSALAIAIAETYGTKISDLGYPTSIAAYDLSFADDARLAVSALGAKLSSLYDDSSQAQLKNQVKAIRIGVQQYDSSGDVRIDGEDAFTDLTHLVDLLSNPAKISNVEVRGLAAAVKTQLNNLILYSLQVSGETGDGVTINLVNASGFSVYFPDRNEGTQLTLTNQIGEKLAHYALGNEWINFTDKYVQYILGNPNTNPGGPSDSGPAHIASGVLPPSGALDQEFNIYLSFVRR